MTVATPVPSRRHFLRAALGAGAGRGGEPLVWDRRHLVGFGTTLALQAGHADAPTLARALDAGVATLQRIEAQMSLFDPGSALSRLNRDGRLAAPPAELLALLRTAQAVAAASDGAFDVTVQPLWTLWSEAAARQALPAPAALQAARALVAWRDLRVSAREIRLRRPGMAVTLNGIAQGHAADRVRAVLVEHGIRDALVDAGEFAMAGRNPRRDPWTLGLADPRADRLLGRLVADGRCIATSADNLTSFSDDHRHHHIFDPRTGDSPPALAGVSVVARDGALADALTKVLFVAGPEHAAALAARWQVDALWIDKRGVRGATPGLRLLPA